MLPFLPDPNYTAEELAAYNAVNEILTVVDYALGTSGNDVYFLGLAPVLESDIDYYSYQIYTEEPVQLNEGFDAEEWLAKDEQETISYNWFGDF